MIDFTGKTLDYVQAALASATTSSARSLRNTATTWRKAKVIRTDPEAGTELEKGATLTVYISKGQAEGR